MRNSDISDDIKRKIKSMYISYVGIKKISSETGVSQEKVLELINSMGLRRRLGKKQLEQEEKFRRMIYEYWEKLDHEVELFSNEIGDVRSDMVNGLPKYLKTTKYLYARK